MLWMYSAVFGNNKKVQLAQFDDVTNKNVQKLI